MTIFILYPAVAMLAMLMVLVIMLILKYGHRWLGLRHTALPDRERSDHDTKGYDHPVSYA